MGTLTTIYSYGIPLAQTYELWSRSGGYPMPGAYKSLDVDFKDFGDFAAAIIETANDGGALLVGNLRAKVSDSDYRQLMSSDDRVDWIALEYTLDYGFDTREALLESLGICGVPVLYRHAPDLGITTPLERTALRGHYLIPLERPVSLTAVKRWLAKLNMESKILRERVTLAPTHLALAAPISLATACPGNLVYVAPPICSKFTDPIANRIIPVQAPPARSGTPPLHEVIEAADESGIDEMDRLLRHMRQEIGLPETPEVEDHSDIGKVVVGGVRLNIGSIMPTDLDNLFRVIIDRKDHYYIDKSRPRYLFDETCLSPPIDLQAVAPNIYEGIREASISRSVTPLLLIDVNNHLLAHIEVDAEGNVVREVVDSAARTPAEVQSKLTRRKNIVKDVDWSFVYNPKGPKIDMVSKVFNLYSPPRIQPGRDPNRWPNIRALLEHISAGDEETFDYIVNWLACIYAGGHRLKTALAIHALDRAGRHDFIVRVLFPLFGENNCVHATHVREMLNGARTGHRAYLSCFYKTLLYVGDLLTFDAARTANNIASRVNDILDTEFITPISGGRPNQAPPPVRNHANVIMAMNTYPSGYKVVILMERCYITPKQTKTFDLKDDNLDSEISSFARFLKEYKYDLDLANKVPEYDLFGWRTNPADARKGLAALLLAIKNRNAAWLRDVWGATNHQTVAARRYHAIYNNAKHLRSAQAELSKIGVRDVPKHVMDEWIKRLTSGEKGPLFVPLSVIVHLMAMVFGYRNLHCDLYEAVHDIFDCAIDEETGEPCARVD